MAEAEDSSLDFCSEEFNPLKALQAKESLLSLPYPEVFFYIALCVNMLVISLICTLTD